MADPDRLSQFLADTEFQKRLGETIREVHRGKAHIDAEDLLQEVLVKALRGRLTFRGTTAEECIAWLRTIARNIVRDAYRKASRRPETAPLVEEALWMLDEAAMNNDDLPEMLEQRARDLQLLNLILAGLSALEIEILRSRAAGLSHKQIGSAIGMQPDTVRQKHFRLLQYIHRLVEIHSAGP